MTRDLQAIASANDIDANEETLQLPQVHAFNCLKDVFTDGRFGSFVEQHMSSSLEIAARALEGDRSEFLPKTLLTGNGLTTHIDLGGPFEIAD